MRIAVLASIAHRTPPRSYGPWEQVASTIAEGLVARGHDVTLFATADSATSGRLHAVAPAGYEEDPSVDAQVAGSLHIAAVFERAHEFDLVSNQFDFLPLTYSRLTSTPVATTIHGFSSERIVPAYARTTTSPTTSPSVTPTAIPHSPTPRRSTTASTSTPSHRAGGDGGFLLFLGRIHPDKGVHAAVEVARRVGMPLVIAGIVQDAAYFHEQVEPYVDGRDVRYVGAVGPAERDRLLGSAARAAAPHRLR